MTASSEDCYTASNLQVLVVSTYFSPDVCGIAPIVGDLCHALACRGHSVTALTSFPHYPEWKNKELCRLWSKRTDTPSDGTTIIRHGALIPANPSGIVNRLCFEFSLFLSLLRSLLLRGQRFDVMYVVCPSLGNVLFARIRGWLYGEPVVVYIQDIPADAAKSTGLAGTWTGRIARAVQRWLLKPVEQLTTISPVMAERIRDTVHPGQPVLLTPNWLTGEMNAAVELARKRFAGGMSPGPAPGRPLALFYSGNIGNKQGLVAFCRFLHQLDLPFEFKIHGNGAAAPELHDQLAQFGDGRFQTGPLLSADAFAEQLQRTDWFVITEKSGVGTAVMPSKLIPAVSLGVPILAICDRTGALGQAVTGHQLGLCLSWDELEVLEEKLTSITDAQREAFRQNGLSFSRHYSRSDRIRAIECILQETCARSRRIQKAPAAGVANG